VRRSTPTLAGMTTRDLLRRFTCAVLVAGPATASAADGYICVADHAIGFVFGKSTKQWSATFTATQKFVIQRATGGDLKSGSKWVVSELGESVATYSCKDDFTKGGLLHCEGFAGEF